MFELIRKMSRGKGNRGPTNAGLAWRSNPLLQACLRTLRGSATVAVPDQREAVEAVVRFAQEDPGWSRVEAVPCSWLEEMVFVLWDDPSLPVLYCRSELLLDSIEDVTAPANETWLVNESLDRIVHFLGHDHILLYPEPNA